MVAENDRALRAIAEAKAWLESLREEAIALELHHLRQVTAIERDPRNAPRSDKSSVAPRRDAYRRHFLAARRFA